MLGHCNTKTLCRWLYTDINRSIPSKADHWLIVNFKRTFSSQNLSQFWYEDSTTEVLAREALKQAGEGGSVACISCPTLYKMLRKIKPSGCTGTPQKLPFPISPSPAPTVESEITTTVTYLFDGGWGWTFFLYFYSLPWPPVKLFEFDPRFGCYGDDFIRYDYKTPLALASDLRSS